jgi:Tol biopolymer transport system component
VHVLTNFSKLLYAAAAFLCLGGVYNHRDTQTQSLREPVIFGEGVISTRDYESSITFTPDGGAAYFVKSSPDLTRRVIVVSHLRKGKWTTPEIASFSGQYSDTDPCFSPDGSKIFFASRRPVEGATPRPDFDLWFVDKTSTGWSEPRHFDAPVNTASNEMSPSATADGTLYFSSNRQGGKGAADIYRAKLTAGRYAVENLGDPVNTAAPELQVFASPDEKLLILAALGRPDGYGNVDLYLSRQVDGAWSKPVNLGAKINSRAVETGPRISADGKYFFWTSTRGYGFEDQQTHRLTYRELSNKLRGAANGLGDIYQIDLNEILNIK